MDLCCLYTACGYAVAGAYLRKSGQPTSALGRTHSEKLTLSKESSLPRAADDGGADILRLIVPD